MNISVFVYLFTVFYHVFSNFCLFFTIIESILMVENLSRGYHVHVALFFKNELSRVGTADPSGAPEFMPGF